MAVSQLYETRKPIPLRFSTLGGWMTEVSQDQVFAQARFPNAVIRLERIPGIPFVVIQADMPTRAVLLTPCTDVHQREVARAFGGLLELSAPLIGVITPPTANIHCIEHVPTEYVLDPERLKLILGYRPRTSRITMIPVFG